MYNRLVPWNAWFALSSQAARVCWATQAGMLRGIARAGAKAETETDRMVTENVGAAEVQIPAAARKSNKKHTGSLKKPCQLPRKGIAAIGKGFGPTGSGLVALTIGSRKSKSAAVKREAEEIGGR
jgi:hypothetical protein